MARVRGRDTGPEMKVRRALHAAGLRYRVQGRGLPGRPDMVFASRRLVVLIHGCFWHQHQDPKCKLARMPKSRPEFWGPKLRGNRERDDRVRAKLKEQGWTVLEVWECEITASGLERLVELVKGLGPARTASGKKRTTA